MRGFYITLCLGASSSREGRPTRLPGGSSVTNRAKLETQVAGHLNFTGGTLVPPVKGVTCRSVPPLTEGEITFKVPLHSFTLGGLLSSVRPCY